MTYFDTPHRRKIAYHRVDGAGPTVVFLHGFRSDMDGTKSLHLEAWAKARGQSYLRFDYSGHGKSSEAFEDGCIGDWAEDAADIIAGLTTGPIVLVGSSMGGWISLLLARSMGARVAGLVTIAAAPDFTTEDFAKMTPEQAAEMDAKGYYLRPSDYGEPYMITRRLLEDGAKHLIFDQPLNLPFPVRMLQGTKDEAVPMSKALRLLEHAQSPDMRLTLVDGADHRFSDAACLHLIETSILEVMGAHN